MRSEPVPAPVATARPDAPRSPDPREIRLDGGGRIIATSPGAAVWLGVDAPRLVGRAVWDVAVPARRRDRQSIRRLGTASLDAFTGRALPVRARRADGSTFDGSMLIDAADGDGASAYVATLTKGGLDGQSWTVAAAALAAPSVMEETDEPLLGDRGTPPGTNGHEIPSALDPILAGAMAHAAPGHAVALMRVRLLDLPLVTEVLGRAAGDELLGATETALRRALPQAAGINRVFGGDVCVVLTGLPGDGSAEARLAAARALESLAGTVEIGGEAVRHSAAIGIALAPRHGDCPAEILALAERAAREPAGSDAEPIRVATLVRGDRLDHLRLRTRLDGVAQRGELRLVYQPIFDLSRSVPYGVEALLRWEDPERGLLSPADFVPVAEETGAIVDLGAWVIEELCRHATGWRAQGFDLQLHFNVSAIELRRRGFASGLLSTVRRHGLPVTTFTLEITESTAVLEGDTALPALERLRAAGMQIAIDDFGAGHSSLSRINELPADMLKIDRALVAGLPESAASKALVTAALQIADALRMRTVAEGIESDRQRRFLAEAGCPLGQGFALGRPVSVDERRVASGPTLNNVPSR